MQSKIFLNVLYCHLSGGDEIITYIPELGEGDSSAVVGEKIKQYIIDVGRFLQLIQLDLTKTYRNKNVS